MSHFPENPDLAILTSELLICLFILLENTCNTRQKQAELDGIVKNKLQEGIRGTVGVLFLFR